MSQGENIRPYLSLSGKKQGNSSCHHHKGQNKNNQGNKNETKIPLHVLYPLLKNCQINSPGVSAGGQKQNSWSSRLPGKMLLSNYFKELLYQLFYLRYFITNIIYIKLQGKSRESCL